MNFLQEYFENNKSNAIHKWIHYFEIYDSHFNKYRDKDPVILEIGVYQGGSLKMWKEYFGNGARIYGIDINPQCKQFETDTIKVFIGSQEDKNFLTSVISQIPRPDIIIDDGGHTMNQQIITFKTLFEHIKNEGIYLCEDLHTSYWENYGGGLRNKNSFIEYSKNLIDSIHAWHSKSKYFKKDKYTDSVYSLHYYDSILVIEKRNITKPNAKITGDIIIPIDEFPLPVYKKSLFKRIKRKLLPK